MDASNKDKNGGCVYIQYQILETSQAQKLLQVLKELDPPPRKVIIERVVDNLEANLSAFTGAEEKEMVVLKYVGKVFLFPSFHE
mmetsp:Transcript_57632/g.130593  ORF Transcript_57632/g.130593 Transcript_57632/m.130593 type:complete len:84 (+) Transcript_57632:301-552(+)